MIQHVAMVAMVLLASGAAAQECTPIRFKAGESGALVDGVLPPEEGPNAGGPDCYSLDVRKGQPISVEVVGGSENVVISVLDVGDARRRFDFRAPSSRVEFIVFQLSRSAREADYSLLVQAN